MGSQKVRPLAVAWCLGVGNKQYTSSSYFDLEESGGGNFYHAQLTGENIETPKY